MSEPKAWHIPPELCPAPEPERLTDAVKLVLVFARLREIDAILRHGLPKRPGSKAKKPVKERDLAALHHVAMALDLE